MKGYNISRVRKKFDYMSNDMWKESRQRVIKSIRRRDRIVRELARGKILELGCNKWWLFEDSVKLDIEKLKGVIIADCNKTLPLKTKFDTIVALELIEHLEKTDVFLNECKRLLNSGGRLIISTDNAVAWFNRVNMFIMCEKFSERFEHLVRLGHKKYYTHKLLKKEIESHGLKTEKIRPMGRIPFLSLCGGFLIIAKKSEFT